MRDADPATLYITACYWTITTLSTVGYGDIRGYTTEEYLYTMLVEFIGIGFFSFIMGSINQIILNQDLEQDIIDAKLGDVDTWLLKLDESRRMQKTLP